MQIAEVFESIRPRYPEFKDQVALVTGSSRGIGKGIALRLAREGMKIVLHGVDADEVAQSTKEFESLGIDVLGVKADFAEDSEIDKLFQSLLDRFGTIDLLVNNAADLRRSRIAGDHMAMLDTQIAVNVRAPYVCAQKAAEIMLPKKHGSIVNISSVGGLRAHWAGLPYDMTKGALDAMTRAMALDLGQVGIRINGIAPGAIRVEKTPPADHPGIQALDQRIPLLRMGDIQEIASVVAFLASSEASYLTGQTLYVDGGITTQLSPVGQPI